LDPSFEYFGKGQGVSACTFIDERNILRHSLFFSASGRESAYVSDGLMHNDVIRSDIHSTDDLELRQAIGKQLNKVELANRFTRAVAAGNPREFAQVEKEEQKIAETCNRLIKNSIICRNYLYLTRRLEQAETPEERDQLLRTIATHSPLAWVHVNMLGEYDFSDEKLQNATDVLPPKNPPDIIPPDWEPPNRQKSL